MSPRKQDTFNERQAVKFGRQVERAGEALGTHIPQTPEEEAALKARFGAATGNPAPRAPNLAKGSNATRRRCGFVLCKTYLPKNSSSRRSFCHGTGCAGRQRYFVKVVEPRGEAAISSYADKIRVPKRERTRRTRSRRWKEQRAAEAGSDNEVERKARQADWSKDRNRSVREIHISKVAGELVIKRGFDLSNHNAETLRLLLNRVGIPSHTGSSWSKDSANLLLDEVGAEVTEQHDAQVKALDEERKERASNPIVAKLAAVAREFKQRGVDPDGVNIRYTGRPPRLRAQLGYEPEVEAAFDAVGAPEFADEHARVEIIVWLRNGREGLPDLESQALTRSTGKGGTIGPRFKRSGGSSRSRGTDSDNVSKSSRFAGRPGY